MMDVVRYGRLPDYNSGPYLDLMTAAVRLAREDLADPLYSKGAREFLDGDLVRTFADCLRYGGTF